MTQYQDLHAELTRTPLLHVDADRDIVRLIDRGEAVRIVAGASGAELAYVMDLARCLASYSRIVGTSDRIYTIDEVAAITGQGRPIVHHYDHAGIITPSVRPSEGSGRGKSRLYSYRDGFLAGVIGSLRRQRVSLDLLRRVADLLRQPAPNTPTPIEQTKNPETIEA